MHDEPRLISSDEKRELILAHASSRQARPSNYSIGYYLAVAVSALFVVSGWWLTLGPSLARSVPKGPDSLAESVSKEWGIFRQKAATIKLDNEPSQAALVEAQRQIQNASTSTNTR